MPKSAQRAGPHTRGGTGDERGSMILGVVCLLAAMMIIGGLAVTVPAQSQYARLRAAAGVAALQAADAQRGLVADLPCPRAERVAAAHGARVLSCTETALGMLVTLGGDTLFGAASATAHAGRSASTP